LATQKKGLPQHVLKPVLQGAALLQSLPDTMLEAVEVFAQ
jgi:hypothetical protein